MSWKFWFIKKPQNWRKFVSLQISYFNIRKKLPLIKHNKYCKILIELNLRDFLKVTEFTNIFMQISVILDLGLKFTKFCKLKDNSKIVVKRFIYRKFHLEDHFWEKQIPEKKTKKRNRFSFGKQINNKCDTDFFEKF